MTTDSTALLDRYAHAVLGVFGRPALVLDRGEGCWVWDVDGKRYLDLLGGIAVNALGHGHPALVRAVTAQLETLGHVSNFFATEPQVSLAERLLALLEGAPGLGKTTLVRAMARGLDLEFRRVQTGIEIAEIPLRQLAEWRRLRFGARIRRSPSTSCSAMTDSPLAVNPCSSPQIARWTPPAASGTSRNDLISLAPARPSSSRSPFSRSRAPSE